MLLTRCLLQISNTNKFTIIQPLRARINKQKQKQKNLLNLNKHYSKL